MKTILALVIAVGSLALSACTTVETPAPAPRTTSVTTQESVTHRPMGGTATTTQTQVSPY